MTCTDCGCAELRSDQTCPMCGMNEVGGEIASLPLSFFRNNVVAQTVAERMAG